MRPGVEGTVGGAIETSNKGVFNLSSHETVNFSLSHRHSGLHGDGQRVPASFINWTAAITAGEGPILTSANGTEYRLGVDNDGAITVTPV